MDHAIRITASAEPEDVALADVPAAGELRFSAGPSWGVRRAQAVFRDLIGRIAPWTTLYVVPEMTGLAPVQGGRVPLWGCQHLDTVYVAARLQRAAVATLLHELFHNVFGQLPPGDRLILASHAAAQGVVFGDTYQDDAEERLCVMFEDLGRLMLMGFPPIAYDRSQGRSFVSVMDDVWSGRAARTIAANRVAERASAEAAEAAARSARAGHVSMFRRIAA